MPTPLASQCCYSADFQRGVFNTLFVRPDKAIVKRASNEGAVACTAANGGPCSGSACYYGPNGFARPWVQAPTTPYPKIYSVAATYPINSTPVASHCEYAYYSSPVTPQFGNVTGTFPTGQGCPGGGTGAGEWDY